MAMNHHRVQERLVVVVRALVAAALVDDARQVDRIVVVLVAVDSTRKDLRRKTLPQLNRFRLNQAQAPLRPQTHRRMKRARLQENLVEDGAVADVVAQTNPLKQHLRLLTQARANRI